MFKLKIQCECDKIKIYAWNRKNLHILFQSTCGITDIMILFSFLSDLEDREFQFVYVFPLLSKRTKNCSKESAGNSTKINSFKCFVIQDFEKEPDLKNHVTVIHTMKSTEVSITVCQDELVLLIFQKTNSKYCNGEFRQFEPFMKPNLDQ